MRISRIISVITILTVFAIALPSFSKDKLETATIKINGIDLIVEVAASARAREKGLMGRKELPDGTGMLFIYPREKKAKLWMRKTLIPLSAAFVKKDGEIAQIVQMKKIKSTKIYSSKEKVKYALEVPLGWFEKNGIKSGDHCVIPDLP